MAHNSASSPSLAFLWGFPCLTCCAIRLAAQLLERCPEMREIALAFFNSRFATCLASLRALRAELEFDAYLSRDGPCSPDPFRVSLSFFLGALEGAADPQGGWSFIETWPLSVSVSAARTLLLLIVMPQCQRTNPWHSKVYLYSRDFVCVWGVVP